MKEDHVTNDGWKLHEIRPTLQAPIFVGCSSTGHGTYVIIASDSRDTFVDCHAER